MSNWKRFLLPTIIGLILALMAGLMVWAALSDSATADEQIHILSGYSTDKYAHIIFDPEHPFLIKALTALPLLLVHPNIPEAAVNLSPHDLSYAVNTYSQANTWGFQFLFASGNNAYQMLFLARSIAIILTLLLGIAIFWWTKKLLGLAPALVALLLCAVDPNILAHGHLVNDDTASALMFVSGIATFAWFLRRQSYISLTATGVVLGLGLISKFSLAILGPAFIILTLIWLSLNPQRPMPLFTRLKKPWQQYVLSLGLIYLIAYLVIWVSYGSLALFNPAANPLVPPPIGQGWAIDLLAHFFPPMWEKGIGFLHVEGGRQGYITGICFRGSRWYYFPLLTLFKAPLGLLILSLISLLYAVLHFIHLSYPSLGLWSKLKHAYQSIPFWAWLIVVSTVLYLAASTQTGINIGIRHALPFYVFLFIVASFPFSKIDWQSLPHPTASQLHLSKDQLLTLFLPTLYCLLLLSVVAGSLLTAPNFLSYYNEISGEPRNIPWVSNDSNTDWGQGTKDLARYVSSHGIKAIAYDSFIGFGEDDYLNLPYTSADPHNHMYQGYIALSRSSIIQHLCADQNDWGWLVDHHQPIAIIDGAINIYKID